MKTAVAARRTSSSSRRRPAKPFTIPHFRDWARTLTLDSGDGWEPDDWQLAWVADLFAGFKEVWLFVPEENGKTTLFGGVGLYHIEHVERAYAPLAASSREQAEWAYRQAEGLVVQSGRSYHPEHCPTGFRCLEGYRRIVCPATMGRIQVHAADDKTGDGIIPTLAMVDELHRHKDLALYRTWAGKLGKRNGQIGVISTAGEPGSEFEEARKAIRERATQTTKKGRTFTRYEIGRRFVLHEYAVPSGPGVDVNDVELVKEANPLSTITAERLAEKKTQPTMTPAHWRRFVCNIATRDKSAAISEPEWALAQDLDAGAEIPDGVEVWAGLDLGWKVDTTALVPLWPRDRDYRLLGPASIIEPPLDGSSTDPSLVEAAILAVHDRTPIHTLVMDMTRGEQLAHWIEHELGIRVVDRGTGNSDAAIDYERFTEGLREGWLRHTGDPGLTGHVMNAIARALQGGKSRFDRPAESRTARRSTARRRWIDGLTAASYVVAVHYAELGSKPKEVLAVWE